MERDVPVDGAKGDGGSARASESDLNWFRQELSRLNGDAGSGTLSRRSWNEDTRFCRWAGQSEDGRKHKVSLGRAAHPFEGASDSRLRLADFVVNVKVAGLVTAGLRAHKQISGMEITDEPVAGKCRTLLNWVLRNALGRTWWMELNRLCQAIVGDSPAVGVMGVFWEQRNGLRSREISADEFQEMLSAVFEIEPDKAAEMMETVILDAEQEEQSAEFLKGLVPGMREARARKVLRAWREGEPADFPEPYVKSNRIRVMALRLWRDIWWPVNTAEVKRARVIFHREWLSRAELEARRVSHGYSEGFVNKVMGSAPGESGFEGQSCMPHGGDGVDGYEDGVFGHGLDSDYEGLFEVVTAYWKAARDDGDVGVYRMAFSGAANMAATEKELLKYEHGEYPFVEFPREVLTGRLLDSRGAPELTMTDQRFAKTLDDVFSDHAQMTFPPVFVPDNRPDSKLEIGPLVQIKRRRQGDYEWMKLPEKPLTTAEQRSEIRRRVYEYWGIAHEDVPDAITDLLDQHGTDGFLWGLSDVYRMIFQLCVQYMTPEELQRIVGGQGLGIDSSSMSVEGWFDVFLDFDVRSLDHKYVLKLAETLSKTVLLWDTDQTVQRDKLTAVIMGMINPNLADETLRPVEEANASEVAEEQINFALIAVGIEPEMAEDGQNFNLRLQVLQGIAQSNPDAIRALSETSGAILQKRVKHFEFMVQQQQNAMTGRVGAEAALADEGGGDAGMNAGGRT